MVPRGTRAVRPVRVDAFDLDERGRIDVHLDAYGYRWFPHRRARRPPAHLTQVELRMRAPAPTAIERMPPRGRQLARASRSSRTRWPTTAETPSWRMDTPIERVGDLHRALLVRDDDELARVAQVLERREQAAEVRVVEGRLDLVHDVERARAAP
jgi:hypothetical protein